MDTTAKPITTRVLTPYYDSLPGGKKGCFFYIAEHDCVALLDTPYRKNDIEGSYPAVHQSEIAAAQNPDCQVAWGFPAYLLAVSKTSVLHCHEGAYQSYFDEYATVRGLEIIMISDCVVDWYRTFTTITPYTGYYSSSVFYPNLVNRIGDIVKDEFSNSYFCKLEIGSLEFGCKSRIRLIGESQTHIASLIWSDFNMQLMFPQLVLTNGDYQACMEAARKNEWMAYGIVATLIRYSLKLAEKDFWKRIDFSDISILKPLSETLKSHLDIDDLFPIIDLQTIRFEFPFSYTEFFEKYLKIVVPVVRDCAARDPKFPLEFSEGDNIYSYILHSEKTAYQVFMANQLYASFTHEQQTAIDAYFSRYIQYLKRQYGASEQLMHDTKKNKQPTSAPLVSATVSRFCTYIVPTAAKSQEEIETDLQAASQRSAAKFREFLHNYRINGYLDFRHESASQIYDTLNERYHLPYDRGNFTRDWNV